MKKMIVAFTLCIVSTAVQVGAKIGADNSNDINGRYNDMTWSQKQDELKFQKYLKSKEYQLYLKTHAIPFVVEDPELQRELEGANGIYSWQNYKRAVDDMTWSERQRWLKHQDDLKSSKFRTSLKGATYRRWRESFKPYPQYQEVFKNDAMK